MLIYRTTVAPRKRLKLIAGTAVVLSESDEFVSVPANSHFSKSKPSSYGCVRLMLLVLGPSSFGLGKFLLFFTLWNYFLRSISSAVSSLIVFFIIFHSNLFFSLPEFHYCFFVRLLVFSGGCIASIVPV